MNSQDCFPPDFLRNYVSGELNDQEISRIESHVAECETCEQTILSLENDPDTIVELLRNNTQPDKEDCEPQQAEPSVCVRAFEEAKELVRYLPDDQPTPAKCFVPIGGEFGAYELIKPLGRGGMATVYLARHRQLRRLVAIKIVPLPSGPGQPSAARFQREIRAAGSLNHPSIVLATDAGERDDLHYLVMEYIDGLDLSRLTRATGQMKIADACELVRQVALGLSHAHAAGIVHRDIKPSNLMLDLAGRAKILDFGLAQLSLWDEAAAELTTVGQLMGTLDYMAPEQAERSGAVDYRADLYALGATLFRLLCGRAPLAAAPNLSPLEKLRMLANHEAPSLDTLRHDAPDELVKLVSSMLARSPDARPASAAHVAQLLTPFSANADLGELIKRGMESPQELATPYPALPGSPQAIPTPSTALPNTDKQASKGSRIRKWLAAAVILPLLAYAGVLIVLETQKGQLVIESDIPDVQVKLHSESGVERELALQPGATTTKLFAGKYEVTLASPSDSIRVENDNFQIIKGQTVIARIRSNSNRQEINLDSTATSNKPGDSSELVYEGKSLSAWLEQLRTDRSPNTIGQSLGAIKALVSPTTSKLVSDTLEEFLPGLPIGVTIVSGPAEGKPARTNSMDYVIFQILQGCNSGSTYGDLLVRLLEKGDSKLTYRVFRFGLNVQYSYIHPVLTWFEEHAEAGRLELESDVRQKLADILRNWARESSKAEDVSKARSAAIRIARKWKGAGPELWLSTPLNEDQSSESPEYRLEVIQQSIASLQDLNSAPKDVASAAMILTALPKSELLGQGDLVLAAIQTKLQQLGENKSRLLSLVEVNQSFRSMSIPASMPRKAWIINIQSRFSPGMGGMSGFASEAIELIELLEKLQPAMAPASSPDLNLKSLMNATLSEYNHTLSCLKPLQGALRITITWDQRQVRYTSPLPASDDIAVSNLTSQEILGYLIHCKVALVAGVQIDDSPNIVNAASNKFQPNTVQRTTGNNKAANTVPGGRQSDSIANAKRPANVREGIETKPQSTAVAIDAKRTSNEPTYEGKPLGDWLSVVKNDRSHATRIQALIAVRNLIDDKNSATVTSLMLELFRANTPPGWNREQLIEWTRSLLETIAQANPSESFERIIITELEANDEQRTGRVLLAILNGEQNQSKKFLANASFFGWLADSPVPLTYSDENWQVMQLIVRRAFEREGTSDELKKLMLEAVLRHPKLGKPFCYALYVESVLGLPMERASEFTKSCLSQVLSMARKSIEDENSSSIEVTMALSALIVYPDVSSHTAELTPSLAKRIELLKHSPERVLSAVNSWQFYNTGGHGTKLFSISPGFTSFWKKTVGTRRYEANWLDHSEMLAVLSVLERLGLTQSFEKELKDIQGMVTNGHAEALKILQNATSRTDLRWPFDDMASKPIEYRGVPQKSWIAFVVHELIAKALKQAGNQTANQKDVRFWGLNIDRSAEVSTSPDITWARTQIDKYDLNNDGVLTPNEWSKMIVKPTSSDVNVDGAITLEELANFRSKK